MITLEIDLAAMGGNCKTEVAKHGEALIVGDRVTVHCSGFSWSGYGFVVEELAESWVIWVNG